MKQKKKKETVEIDVKVLKEMKAEELQMKLNMQNLADQLDEAQDELETTKESLRVVSKDLRDTRQLLHSAVLLQEEAEDTANACEFVLRKFVMRWLTKENQECMKNMLRFYHPLQRVKMMNALVTYLLFGKKQGLDREVEKAHFKIICEKIDDDCITLPAHSFMVNLMRKYGLNKALKEIANEQ